MVKEEGRLEGQARWAGWLLGSSSKLKIDALKLLKFWQRKDSSLCINQILSEFFCLKTVMKIDTKSITHIRRRAC